MSAGSPTPLRVLKAAALDEELRELWGGALLAEVTHAPSGFSGLDLAPHSLPPGDCRQWTGGGPALLTVIEGRLRISAGTISAVAAAGESVAIAPDTSVALTALDEAQVRYLLLLG